MTQNIIGVEENKVYTFHELKQMYPSEKAFELHFKESIINAIKNHRGSKAKMKQLEHDLGVTHGTLMYNGLKELIDENYVITDKTKKFHKYYLSSKIFPHVPLIIPYTPLNNSKEISIVENTNDSKIELKEDYLFIIKYLKELKNKKNIDYATVTNISIVTHTKTRIIRNKISYLMLINLIEVKKNKGNKLLYTLTPEGYSINTEGIEFNNVKKKKNTITERVLDYAKTVDSFTMNDIYNSILDISRGSIYGIIKHSVEYGYIIRSENRPYVYTIVNEPFEGKQLENLHLTDDIEEFIKTLTRPITCNELLNFFNTSQSLMYEELSKLCSSNKIIKTKEGYIYSEKVDDIMITESKQIEKIDKVLEERPIYIILNYANNNEEFTHKDVINLFDTSIKAYGAITTACVNGQIERKSYENNIRTYKITEKGRIRLENLISSSEKDKGEKCETENIIENNPKFEGQKQEAEFYAKELVKYGIHPYIIALPALKVKYEELIISKQKSVELEKIKAEIKIHEEEIQKLRSQL